MLPSNVTKKQRCGTLKSNGTKYSRRILSRMEQVLCKRCLLLGSLWFIFGAVNESMRQAAAGGRQANSVASERAHLNE